MALLSVVKYRESATRRDAILLSSCINLSLVRNDGFHLQPCTFLRRKFIARERKKQQRKKSENWQFCDEGIAENDTDQDLLEDFLIFTDDPATFDVCLSLLAAVCAAAAIIAMTT